MAILSRVIGSEVGGAYRFLTSYRVFNAAQIDGLDAGVHPELDGDPTDGPEPIPACQPFFDAIRVATIDDWASLRRAGRALHT